VVKEEKREKPVHRKTPRKAATKKGKKLCGCGCGNEVKGRSLYVNDAHKMQAFRNRKKEESTA
jgi:hypothetical protein